MSDSHSLVLELRTWEHLSFAYYFYLSVSQALLEGERGREAGRKEGRQEGRKGELSYLED